ncbi:hypothetical protein EYY99_02985 [Hafnia alvei]|uniref:Cox family DNA-binding protein n=1 Tax=Hafnia alvei TaxID=569 RepID=UPI0010334EC3|nr:Cox family DNA-binding protein [Hafnia alvei]TBL46460.1 hypothetical protein EYY99_02985 [Hafnia alvei]
MREKAEILESESGEQTEDKGARAAFNRDPIRISENPSALLSIEGFALYVGRTKRAIEEMAKSGKLPVHYMVDPSKPGGHAQTWINREDWDEFARQLVQNAPPEWHEWKNRFSYSKKPHARSNKAKAA